MAAAIIVYAILFGFAAGTAIRLIVDMEKERRGFGDIAKVMRRQRDDCRAAGEPWVAGRAWPRKGD